MKEHNEIIDSPKVIYLCYGDISTELGDVKHSECSDVTWCEDEVDVSDIRYVRADKFAELEAQLSRAMKVVTAAERIVNWKKARFEPTDSIRFELKRLHSKPSGERT